MTISFVSVTSNVSSQSAFSAELKFLDFLAFRVLLFYAAVQELRVSVEVYYTEMHLKYHSQGNQVQLAIEHMLVWHST